MSQIKVAFGGKPLFEWEGTAIEIERCETDVAEMAARAGYTIECLQENVIHYLAKDANRWFRGRPGDQGVQMLFVLSFLMSRPMNELDRPGFYRDYIPLWDFSFDICVKADKFEIDVCATQTAAGHA